MHRSRKSIAAIAVAGAGVLAMAGVATAAHGSPKPKTSTSATKSATVVHHQTRHGHGATGAGAVASAAKKRVVVSPVTPETGDDSGTVSTGHDDSGDDDVTTTTVEGATTTSMPEETTTTVPGIPNGMQTFTVAGGTVVVDIEDGVLSLVSATPNPGFEIEKSEVRPDRVEVEFRGNDTESRVRVRIDDGRLRTETRDHS